MRYTVGMKRLLIGLTCLALVGCQNPFSRGTANQPGTAPGTSTGSQDANYVQGLANVDEIEGIRIESGPPLEASVKVRGYLPDGCTELMTATVVRNGFTYDVTLPTRREKDAACTQAIVDFERSIPLDVAGAPNGTYTVMIHGKQDSFTLGEAAFPN